jgi:hypothetical protein
VTSESPLWDWGTVAAWFYRQNRLTWQEAITAQTMKLANEHIARGKAVTSLEAEVDANARSLEAA